MKEQALIGARGLVSPSLCIPVLQSVSCYRGAAVMPFSRRLWRVLGEVGLADEVGGMEAGLRTVVGSGGTRLSGGQAQRLTVARNLPTGVGRTWSRILRASLPVPWREAVGQLMVVH